METNQVVAIFAVLAGFGFTVNLINTFKRNGRITAADVFWALTFGVLSLGYYSNEKESDSIKRGLFND